MGNGNGCTLRKFQRNLYFYGKLMTVRDFQMEQDYLNGKRHLLNRLVLGSGVVCGLEVTATFDATAAKVNLAIAKGVAIDCGGREIVVELGENLSFEPEASAPAYCLWLTRTDCGIEPAPCPVTDTGNVCGESCCPSRMLESATFSVEKWTDPVPAPDSAYAGSFTTAVTGGQADIRALLKAHFERVIGDCAGCGDPCRVPVALIVRKGGAWNGIPDVVQNSVVHGNPELFELLRRHQTDLGNPHLTTATQVGALKSVDGVENPGGNVDLIAANAVAITADNTTKRITIGESHSARTDNPHATTAAQVGALKSVDGVENPGGNVDLIAANAVAITADNATKRITIGESHSARTDNPHATTHEQTGPPAANPDGSDTTRNRHLSDADAQRWNLSLTGLKVGSETVGNPGAAVTLVAGANITLDADSSLHSITVSAAGGGISARTGRVTLVTNEKGEGVLRVDSGFDHANFCVQLGIDHGENVDYGSVVMYAASPVYLMGRVHRQPQSLTGQFDILITGAELGATKVSVRWVAIPAEPVLTPPTGITATVVTPTFTVLPTFTATMVTPTLTMITPTLTATILTPTMFTPTLMATVLEPTMTMPIMTATMLTPSDPVLEPLASHVMATAATIGGIGAITAPSGLGGATIITRGKLADVPSLTQVKGVGRASSEKLSAAGIKDAPALAKADAEAVAKALGITDLDRARRFIAEAQTLTGKK